MHYNTVWITDKSPDVVEPTFAALPDKELNYMIDRLASEQNGKVKMYQIGKYTMAEYGHPFKAVFFCDVDDHDR